MNTKNDSYVIDAATNQINMNSSHVASCTFGSDYDSRPYDNISCSDGRCIAQSVAAWLEAQGLQFDRTLTPEKDKAFVAAMV